MTRDARSFTRNNHTKICRLPVPRVHKLGWQETHTFHKKLLKNSAAPIIIIGDSIAKGLRRYRPIWRNYFKDTLNLSISGDRFENDSWRVRDISLPHTTLLVIIHCGTNNVDQSQPEDIVVGVMKIAETFMKNHPKVTTIITGMLPRDKTTLFGEQKSMKQTRYWKRNARTSRKHILWIRMTTGRKAIWYQMKIYTTKIFFT